LTTVADWESWNIIYWNLIVSHLLSKKDKMNHCFVANCLLSKLKKRKKWIISCMKRANESKFRCSQSVVIKYNLINYIQLQLKSRRFGISSSHPQCVQLNSYKLTLRNTTILDSTERPVHNTRYGPDPHIISQWY